jgi:hypothetical protein
MVSKMKSAGKTTAEIKKKLSEFAMKAKNKVMEKGGKAKAAAKGGVAVGAGAYVLDSENRRRKEDEEE